MQALKIKHNIDPLSDIEELGDIDPPTPKPKRERSEGQKLSLIKARETRKITGDLKIEDKKIATARKTMKREQTAILKANRDKKRILNAERLLGIRQESSDEKEEYGQYYHIPRKPVNKAVEITYI
jgi:hypothetical protein